MYQLLNLSLIRVGKNLSSCWGGHCWARGLRLWADLQAQVSIQTPSCIAYLSDFFQPFTDMCEQKKAITCILASCSYLRDREPSRLRLCFFLLRNGFCLRKLSFRFTNVADGSRTDGGCRRFAIISLAEVVSWFETRRARVQRSS